MKHIKDMRVGEVGYVHHSALYSMDWNIDFHPAIYVISNAPYKPVIDGEFSIRITMCDNPKHIEIDRTTLTNRQRFIDADNFIIATLENAQ